MFQHVYLREGIKFGIALPSVPTCFDIYIARTLCKRGLQKGSAYLDLDRPLINYWLWVVTFTLK